MAVLNLEKEWQRIAVPAGKTEAVYFHDAGAGRGYSALALKVRASGKHSWFFEYRKDGKIKRRTFGSPNDGVDYNGAERKRLINLHTLSLGLDPATVAEQEAAAEAERARIALETGATVGRIIDQFIEHELEHGVIRKRGARQGEQRRPGYIAKTKRTLELLRSTWGARPAAAIEPREVTEFLDAYSARPAMQQYLWTIIVMLFGWAKGRGQIKVSPSEGMAARGHSKERSRYLDDAELALLLPEAATIGYPGGAIIRLALLTGRRISEITLAEWSEFDLDRAVWTLPAVRAKNGKAHTLPLSPTALAIMRDAAERKVGDGRYVFHRPNIDKPVVNLGADLKRCRRVAMAATLKRDPEQRIEWTPHDLRRTAATHLEALECPDTIIKQVLNHTIDRGITGVYLRSDPLERMRKWLTTLDHHYASLVPLALPKPEAA